MLRIVFAVVASTLLALMVAISPAQAKSAALPWFKGMDLTTDQQELMEKLGLFRVQGDKLGQCPGIARVSANLEKADCIT